MASVRASPAFLDCIIDWKQKREREKSISHKQPQREETNKVKRKEQAKEGFRLRMSEKSILCVMMGSFNFQGRGNSSLLTTHFLKTCHTPLFSSTT